MTISHTLYLAGTTRGVTFDRSYERETTTIHVDNGAHIVSITVPTASLQELIKKAGLGA